MENKNLKCIKILKQDISYNLIKNNTSLLELHLYKKYLNWEKYFHPSKEFYIINKITFTNEHSNSYFTNKNIIKNLNRFSDIKAYKYNIVNHEKYFNYFNGNYIKNIFNQENENIFIATQAPVPDSFENFWRTILEDKVEIIIMMLEKNFDKVQLAEKYWKSKNSLKLNSLEIVLLEENQSKPFIERKFLIKDLKNNLEKNITQYHIHDWKDKEIPKDFNTLKALNEVLDIIDDYKKNSNNPILVHCRAGVGRTGTIIALYFLRNLLKSFKNNLENLNFSIFLIVRALREQRMLAVQSSGQYNFLYGYVKEFLKNNIIN